MRFNWNEFNSAGPLGVSTDFVDLPVEGGGSIHAYFAATKTDRPAPGIVLVHHMPGWDEVYLEFAERFARHGYLVICPDLYCQYGHGTPEDVGALVRSKGGVHDETVIRDCSAAMEWLRSLPECNGKIGIIGGCSGGRNSVLVASLIPGFDAVVDLWGGGVVMEKEQLSEARPAAPIDYTDRLNVPLLGLFGNEDHNPTAEQVDIHERELKRLNKTYEFHRYDGAGHGFFYYDQDRYRPAQAMDGWRRVFDFFDQHLWS